MTLTGIHFILTYTCTRECDHCFLFGSPKARGKFTVAQIQKVLDQAKKIGTIRMIYFEGGEPFLSYSTMLEGIRIAKEMNFNVGIVTNGYWAKDEKIAEKLLKPLLELGIADLSISDDELHSSQSKDSPAKIGIRVAKKLGIPVGRITIDNPVDRSSESSGKKGKPIIGGDVRFRGRAVDMIFDDLSKKYWKEFDYCSHEELKNPERIHVDSFGNVFLCQGISLGNMWEKPLSKIVEEYNFANHPIFSFIENGGPALLAQEYGVPEKKNFVDECHLCYSIRKDLLDKLPEILAPRHVYGYFD